MSIIKSVNEVISFFRITRNDIQTTDLSLLQDINLREMMIEIQDSLTSLANNIHFLDQYTEEHKLKNRSLKQIVEKDLSAGGGHCVVLHHLKSDYRYKGLISRINLAFKEMISLFYTEDDSILHILATVDQEKKDVYAEVIKGVLTDIKEKIGYVPVTYDYKVSPIWDWMDLIIYDINEIIAIR